VSDAERSTAPIELDARTRWSIRLGTLLLRGLAATWRIRVHGRTPSRARRAAGAPPVILTLWHGQMLPILVAHRGEPCTVLVSEHRDGEIIARILAAFGFHAARGSTTRGGSRALLQLAQLVRDGHDIAITPDGPRGPRREMAPGALLIAQRTGAPLVPLVAHCSATWRLRTWDAFEIPKPFARVTVLYDTPHPVAAATARDAAARAESYQRVMMEALSRCAALHEGGARLASGAVTGPGAT
jgi:lysophospholipid acyltransferase (LPLAT)-like uncharacterized protein